MSGSNLLAALTGDKPAKAASKRSPKVVVVQHAPAAPTEYKEPSPKQRTKESAQRQKSYATDDWVAGRMTTKEHTAIHARANHVIKGGDVRKFKGKSGERKGSRSGGMC